MTEVKVEVTEEERNLSLLKELSLNPQFAVWRDWVAKPILAQLKADLNNADQLDEVVLRAKLKYLALVEELFYGMFDKLDN